MFDVDGYSEAMTRPYFKQLGKEDFLWFLDDVVEAGRSGGVLAGDPLLNTIATRIDEIGSLYASNEAAYFDQVGGTGRRELTKLFLQLCRDKRGPLLQMGQKYAYEVGDRILHDRELCHFIAETVINIGFNGETEEGMHSQWVERERWPTRIKEILRSRDRGKCAACGVDIVQELREEGHIDHMFALARGGCNDLVNLQLLCSECNLKKLDRAKTATTSVPQYLRRPKTRRRVSGG
jgi:5-methylcytosine-specific restriction endonuclease McrA